MDSIPPGRLLALVRPGNDLVLKTLRAGVWLQHNDPEICLQFGSRLHFKRANLCRANKKVPKKGVPEKKGKGVSFGKA